MHNLRSILGTSDAEGLAERTSRALQEQVEHAANSLWRYDSWQQLPPAASISICRADGASIRAAPRPQAVVPRLVHQLQRAGWPPQLPTVAPAATEAGNQHSPTSQHGGAGAAAALPSGLLHAVQQCQHRQGLVHEQQVSQLRHLSGYKPAPQAARPWRANLTALQAAAGKLPDEDTARWARWWLMVRAVWCTDRSTIVLRCQAWCFGVCVSSSYLLTACSAYNATTC